MNIDVFCRVRDGNLKTVIKSDSQIIQHSYLKKKYNFIVNQVWNNTIDNYTIFRSFLLHKHVYKLI